ncbi:MAG: Asp-tRNA(Asn)/Glu-tRNA(Gln) amidotransferase GatCAB subunit C [Bacteroidetes bacterium]|nr:MAG: Asp-tRNA(Asn)/Glu-tRNA(Gln) amidotransferase GatCAB subunit C [Bacteroidota bacterium]
MHIDEKLISRLENLARLELSPQEREKIKNDLNRILEMVGKLEELPTDDVEPLVYVNEEMTPLREDEVRGQVSNEAALKNAPDKEGPYFKVPKVIDL